MNPHEALARTSKALAIADNLQAIGVSSSEAAGMAEASWLLAADAARQKYPSEATRDLVVKLLRDRERAVQSGISKRAGV